MNYKEFNFSLPIDTNRVPLFVGLVQYDTANILNIELLQGTKPFDFSRYTNVFVEILKPDGTHIQAAVSDRPELSDINNNPYSIQIMDPAEGRISMTIQGQATLLTGTYFGQIMITAGGKILTSARFNYYVNDTLQEDQLPDRVLSSDEYSSLRTLIAQNSAIATDERGRVDAETQRKLAELAREKKLQALINDVQEYLQVAQGYVDKTEANLELCKKYAQLAQNPSQEIIADLIRQMGLADKKYVTDQLALAMDYIDAGDYAAAEETWKKILMKRGTSTQIPILDDGELAYATDTKVLYAGGGGENIPLNGVYVASDTAPDRTDLLWIDTSQNGSIKYYDGASWQPTATATFA